MTPTSSRIPFGLAALLCVTLITGTLSQRLSPDPLPAVYTPGASLLAEAEAAGFTLLSPESARSLHQAGSHLFLDARSLDEYHQGHIPGAFPVPVNAFDLHFPDIAPILMPDSPLIAYCSNPACDQALRLAERLRDAGDTNVNLFPAGYDAWSTMNAEETRP